MKLYINDTSLAGCYDIEQKPLTVYIYFPPIYLSQIPFLCLLSSAIQQSSNLNMYPFREKKTTHRMQSTTKLRGKRIKLRRVQRVCISFRANRCVSFNRRTFFCVKQLLYTYHRFTLYILDGLFAITMIERANTKKKHTHFGRTFNII